MGEDLRLLNIGFGKRVTTDRLEPEHGGLSWSEGS